MSAVAFLKQTWQTIHVMKNKQTLAIIIAACLLIGLLFYYFAFVRHTATQLLVIENDLSFVPGYIPPSTEDWPYYAVANTTIDWFQQYRQPEAPHLFPTSVRYDLKTGTYAPNELNSHRVFIPRLWALSKLVIQTNNFEKMSWLETLTNAIYEYMQTEPNGFRLVWQTNYYHCFLIDQIITATPFLSPTTQQQLGSFCSEAAGEVTAVTNITQIATKAQLLADPDPNADNSQIFWNHDQSVQEVLNNVTTAQEPGYPFTVSDVTRAFSDILNKNIIFLTERVIKEKYPPQTEDGVDLEVDYYLDGALSSYYLTLQIPDLTPDEKYTTDLQLLLGLQTYRDFFPEKALEYQLNQLENYLLGQLVTPDVENGSLIDDLYSQQHLFPLLNLCFLEKNVHKSTNLVPQIQAALLEYYLLQQERFRVGEDEPFFIHYQNDFGTYLLFDLLNNGLAAGCLVRE